MGQKWKIHEALLEQLGVIDCIEDRKPDTSVTQDTFKVFVKKLCSQSMTPDQRLEKENNYYSALGILLEAAGLINMKKFSGDEWKLEVVGMGFRTGITAYNSLPMEHELVWEQVVELLYGIVDLKVNPALDKNPELSVTKEQISEVVKPRKAELRCHNPVVKAITMEDGIRIRGIMWMPFLEEGEKIPLIIEATPYRHMDKNLINASKQGVYFASHGFVYMGLDLRGSGASEGILTDEYTEREHNDIINVINWSTRQSWSNGACGMIGISWSGFTALQVAYKQPKALKAIVTACSTDDRYRDDAHFQGGAILANSMPVWASSTLSNGVLPPDPCIDPENWKKQWKSRMEKSPQFIDTWMKHLTRDNYWAYGSICEDYSRIQAATMIAGGFSDGYTSPAFRMMDSLTCPKKAIIGPWAHGYGFEAVPGPDIAFLGECARWFDQWLKGKDTGIMDEPDLKVYVQAGRKPEVYHGHEEGHWEGLPLPLSGVTEEKILYLSEDGSVGEDMGSGKISYYSKDLSIGFGSGTWCPFGGPQDWPAEQKKIDEKCLSFDSAPLIAPLTLLGIPEIQLEVSVDTKTAEIIVRLLDVDETGAVTLISRGMLDLQSRKGFDRRVPVVPGEVMKISIDLKACSYILEEGHKLRVSVSTSYWPWIFPTADTPKITVYFGESSYINLPVLPRNHLFHEVEFADKDDLAPLSAINESEDAWCTGDVNDIPEDEDGIYRIKADYGGNGTYYPQLGLHRMTGGMDEFYIEKDNPLSARVQHDNSTVYRRGDWWAEVTTSTVMSVDEENYHVETSVKIKENGKIVHSIQRQYKYKK